MIDCPVCGRKNSEFNLHCTVCGELLPEHLPQGTGSGESHPGVPAPDTALETDETRRSLPPERDGRSTPLDDPLLGRRVSHYQVLGKLGSGGMGTVYRARHVESGTNIAIKSVRKAQESLLPRMRREIHALARVRHPGIVRILDSGTFQGLPWYAMELIEGPTLRDLGRMAVTGAQDLRHRLSVVCRLCSALGYLHGEGLIHRDLKPDNVLVREGGVPVLVDFGLASEFSGPLGRETLAAETGIAGTPQYMAPEQFLGDLLDARTDLYSLGCILYWLLTGRPPFHGRSASEVALAHMTEAPVPPSELAAGLPGPLDEMVLRLLAKSPRDRLGHADDVAAVLRRLGAVDSTGSERPAPRAYLYRPELAGRQPHLLEIDATLARLTAGTGGLMLVGGESGVGKTRLALEVARKAQRLSVRVLSGECLPQVGADAAQAAGGSGPLGPLRRLLEAVADRCRDLGRSETERLLGRRGKVLCLYEPELAALPGQDAYPEPVPLPPADARRRLFSSLTETVAALAGGYPQATGSERADFNDVPILLILDDLQWADELTLGWLEYWLRAGSVGAHGRAPLLVLGTFRTEDLGAQHAAPLRALLDDPAVSRIFLARLDEAAIGQMVCDMLALQRPPPILVQFLSRQTEGNPFFLAEYLRAAVAEGMLYRNPDGFWEVAEPGQAEASAAVYEALLLPGSLRDLVLRRLEGLTAAARRSMQAAAVLGREVDETLLDELVHVGRSERMEAVQELLVRGVMEASGARGLRFAHDKIREVVYQSLPSEPRRRLHRAAARAIERHMGSGSPEAQAHLGRHWQQAGAPDKARPCYAQAARGAVARYAYAEAERLYQAYRGLLDVPTPESIQVSLDVGFYMLRIQGRSSEAIELGRQALAEARQIGDRVSEMRCLRALGTIFWEAGQMEEAGIAMEASLQIAREIGTGQDKGILLGNLALLRSRQGQRTEPIALYEQALALHREAGSRVHEGQALVNLAGHLEDQGRLEEARDLLEQALTINRDIGQRPVEGMVLNNLASVAATLGRTKQAIALCEQALLIHREVGNLRQEGLTLGNLAHLQGQEGQQELARVRFAQALAALRQSGDRRYEAVILGYLASLERRTGGLAEAELLARQAESALRQLDDALYVAACLCEQGHVALARGLPAQQLLQEAQATAARLEASPRSELGQAVARLQHAVEAFEAGRPLFQGECIEDLPAGLRQGLVEQGLLRAHV